MRRLLHLGLIAVALALCTGAKPGKDVKLQADFTGAVTLEGNLLTDASVVIVASGPGEAKNLGSLSNAEIRWTVSSDVIMGLLSGELDEAPLNSGTFKVQTGDGRTVVGTFSAVVKRHGRFAFKIIGDFDITGGANGFEGISGDGRLRGTLDLRTAAYTGNINGSFTPPGE
jgi:hypothetical protein